MISQEKLAEMHYNYDAFTKALPTLLDHHADQYVLMRRGEFIAYFDSPRDALLSGRKMYEDDLFSVQEVTSATADLGWYSRAPSNPGL